MPITRRKLLKNIWLGCLWGGAASFVDAFAVEPNIIIVNNVDLPIKNLPAAFAGKTIGHISDLHCGSCASQSYLLGAVRKLNSLTPDIVILTGDYTSKYDKKDYFHLLPDVFSAIKAPLGVFACLGNHEYGLSFTSNRGILPLTREALNKGGAVLLQNSSYKLNIDGQSIYIVGMGDDSRWDCKPADAFSGLDGSAAKIVIAHSPDCIRRLGGFDYDAFLCGHTHGGQVCAPIFGPIHVPTKDKRFKKGQYSYEGRFVYVNSGLATMPTRYPGPRFLCPPEITFYTLRGV